MGKKSKRQSQIYYSRESLTVLEGFNVHLHLLGPDRYVVLEHMVGIGNADLTALRYIWDVRQLLLVNWQTFLFSEGKMR